MKLQSDWLIQVTEKLHGPDLRDEYEVLGRPEGEMNIEHDRRRAMFIGAYSCWSREGQFRVRTAEVHASICEGKERDIEL